MNNNEIKPCPFCGNEATVISTISFGKECKSVSCLKCHAKVNNFAYYDENNNYNEEKSENRAVEMWNKRTFVDIVNQKKIDAFKYWIDTNSECGVVSIPEYLCKDIYEILKHL